MQPIDSTCHILLVEDSRTQATNLVESLSRHGWTVEWVFTAEAAMERIHQADFDLIVLDYYLPGMRGDALCRKIRLSTGARDLPILILTAENTQTAEVHLLESGADDFVLKSADEDILLARIRALLTKSRNKMPVFSGADIPIRATRILTIDDSATYQEYLAGELEQEGYHVERATTGRVGLDRLASVDFDCVIVDLVMPDLDGIEVCRRIAELRTTANNLIAVLMLTGRENKEELTQALEAGADDFVGKSSEMAVLKSRIRALLRRKLLQEENRRIIEQLKTKEVEMLRARADAEVAEAKAKLNDELELRVKLRTAELAAANHDLAAKSRENEMFVYSVSHDLRSPLVNLQGFSNELNSSCGEFRQILAEPELPANLRLRCLSLLDGEMAEALRFIQTAVKRLSTNIDSLLRLSRVGRVEFQCQAVDVQSVVERIVIAMNDTIRRRGAEVLVSHLPPVWGDPAAIEQIFANLIGNAVNYLSPDRPGRLEIGLHAKSEKSANPAQTGMQTYFVRDNGMGIPASYANKVFQIFQRMHPTLAQGEGIGLALTRRVVERHGGRIWFESAEAVGTTFFVSLSALADTPLAAGAPACVPQQPNLTVSFAAESA
ncbi:MAG TPA: response regulator [Pirellulales bacterium]|jgi:two-component system NtrC family sensor kinase|nr:response regulator [Pirellulales bacterium]